MACTVIVTHPSTGATRTICMQDHSILNVGRYLFMDLIREKFPGSDFSSKTYHRLNDITRGTHGQIMNRGKRLSLYILHPNGVSTFPYGYVLEKGESINLNGRAVRWSCDFEHPQAHWTDLRFEVEGNDDAVVTPRVSKRLRRA